MKSNLFIYILAGACAAFVGCGHDEHSDEHDNDAHSHESDLLSIHIEDDDAAMLGIDTVCVRAADFVPTLTLSGEISAPASEIAVVTSPTSGNVIISPSVAVGSRVGRGSMLALIDATRVAGADTQAQAEATLRAARDEYERLKPLRERGLVTASQLNAAREAYEVARAALPSGATHRSATSPVEGTVTAINVANGAYVAAGDPIATVTRSGRLTLKAYLPDRKAGSFVQSGAVSISLPGSNAPINLADFNLKQLSGAGAATEGGYIPLVFTFDNPGLPTGVSATKVYVAAGEPRRALTVPTDALTEDLGQYFVYRLTSPEHYLKTPVLTGATNGSSTEILSGLADGDVVVAKGAPMVRMAQSQAAPVHGHSHNH